MGNDLLARHSYLQSLLEDTNRFLCDSRLTLIHTDNSFYFFDVRVPNPWLIDVAQAEWLLHNHEQIQIHNGTFLRRVFPLPNHRLRSLEERALFRACVKTVIHLQMYEGVRVGILPVPSSHRSTSLNFSFASIAKTKVAWQSTRYYDGVQNPEAQRALSGQFIKVERQLEAVLPNVLWLAPYRAEHFESGRRVSLPGSWRKFLFLLCRGRCENCNRPVRNLGELDHARPLKPEESQWHSPPPGNSTLFNLSLFCRRCNREKFAHFKLAPERYIRQLIWDRKLELYLRVSLQSPPSDTEHVLPHHPQIMSE